MLLFLKPLGLKNVGVCIGMKNEGDGSKLTQMVAEQVLFLYRIA
jgi:hypothetical protein